MRKILTVLTALIFMLPMSACVDTRSQAERDLEESNKRLAQARENSKKAQEDYDNLVQTLEDYQRLKEALD